MSADLWVAFISAAGGALLLAGLWASFRDICPASPDKRHVWDYRARGIAGWGVVRCSLCDKADIY